jgi:biotin-(acetyl-CoA carboxylase) ligase
VIGIAKKITLTEKQCDVLSQIVTSRTHRLAHIERAQIILLSSALKPNVQISQKLSISISTVKKWRKRWLKNEEKLLLVDEKEKGINYVRKILAPHVHLQRNKCVK